MSEDWRLFGRRFSVVVTRWTWSA